MAQPQRRVLVVPPPRRMLLPLLTPSAWVAPLTPRLFPPPGLVQQAVQLQAVWPSPMQAAAALTRRRPLVLVLWVAVRQAA